MENVTDALKMGAAAMIFIIAFTITMALFTQARQTTDKVIDSFSLSEYLPKVEPLGYDVTRKVGFETVIPTIYRYAQSDENIQIRIVDGEQSSNSPKYELQIFDVSIENMLKSTTDDTSNPNYYYYQLLLTKYDNPSRPAYMAKAPWSNQGATYILDRINAYIYGTNMKYFGSNNDLYNGKGLMQKFQAENYKYFEETYLKYRINGDVSIDEYGEEIVTLPASTKTIITYKMKK